jgi:hypothetical protein
VRYWWVNQNKTHEQEQKGTYLWSPKTNRDGAYNQFYENMKHVAAGDLVFCYWDGLLQACGIVASSRFERPRPSEFGDAGKASADNGYPGCVTFRPINPPVSRKFPGNRSGLFCQRAVTPARKTLSSARSGYRATSAAHRKANCWEDGQAAPRSVTRPSE